jgi:hypothetical protein
MSWRDIARAAVQREAGEGSEALAPEQFRNFGNNADASISADAEALAEREAIAIVDGGLPPDWAAALSLLERRPKPVNVTEKEWRRHLDAVWRRASEHGAEFAANGWTFESVFGVGENWFRFDQRGAAFIDPEAVIVAITPREVVLTVGKDRMTHRRPH